MFDFRLYVGELAALGAAASWSVNSILFTFVARRAGANNLNHLRIYFAAVYLAVIQWVLYGQIWPAGIGTRQIVFLFFSSIIGMVIGDAFLFHAYVFIGPRLAILLQLLAPLFSAILGAVFLSEYLLWTEWAAMMITIAGIAWVVLEKRNTADGTEGKRARGIFFAVMAALGQALGLLLSKFGMTGGMKALSANHIRMLSAALLLLFLDLGRRKLRSRWSHLGDRKTALAITCGSMLGPVIGISLSLASVQFTSLGVASTLMSISPILLIPLSHWIYKEKINWRAILGTLISMLGIVWLFLGK